MAIFYRILGVQGHAQIRALLNPSILTLTRNNQVCIL